MPDLVKSNSAKYRFKEQELNILRIVFFIGGIISPIVSYLWACFDSSTTINLYMGWLMSILYLGLSTLSYKIMLIKNSFSIISFLMFSISSMSALYHSAVNNFDYGYILLFFLIIFATTLFIRKPFHMILLHTLFLAQLMFTIFYYEVSVNRAVIVVSVHLVLIIITTVNAYLISSKQEKIDVLISIIENINKSNSFKETLQYIYNTFSLFLPYNYIGIALIKDEGKTLDVSYGISDGSLESLSEKLSGYRKIDIDKSAVRKIIENDNAMILNDIKKYTSNNLIEDSNAIIKNAGINACVSCRLMVNTVPVGIIFFLNRKKNVYTSEHARFLEALAGSISISIEKCILLDDLTYSNIMSLVKLAELRDDTTGNHLDRMKTYTKIIAQLLFEESTFKELLSNQYIDELEKFAPMHDIGKVGIQDGILLKPGKLTVAEFDEIKKHTLYGAQVVREAVKFSLKDNKDLFKMGLEIIENHHEKWDGSGYPCGKKEKEIPLCARIVAVADVFDALTSNRPYKQALSFETSFNIICEGNGNHFDPEIIRVFSDNKIKILEAYNICMLNHDSLVSGSK